MADPLESLLNDELSHAEPTDPPAALMGLIRARRRDTIARSMILASIVLTPILAITIALSGSTPQPVAPPPPQDTTAVRPDLGLPDDPSLHAVASLRNRDPSIERDDFPIPRTPSRATREIERPMSPAQIDRLLSGRD